MSAADEVRGLMDRYTRGHAPRIRKVAGHWYAFGKHTPTGKLLLVPAINWCKRMNTRIDIEVRRVQA